MCKEVFFYHDNFIALHNVRRDPHGYIKYSHMGFFDFFSREKKETLDKGLSKTKEGVFSKLARIVAGKSQVDDAILDDLEEVLITSDVGVETTLRIIERIEKRVARDKYINTSELNRILREEITELLTENGVEESGEFTVPADKKPYVIMVVGVNGVGKTTTIGKLAYQYKKRGYSVYLGAADTFRAGATEQLEVWAQRDGVDIVTGPENSDPAAVVFDAVTKAKKDNYDVLFVDTAGRLQNKVNLMNELAKMKRILTREIPDAPHEVLLVLDATTGQNALTQAKLFKETTDVTGIVLTKLDGTARGGIVLAIRNELHLPVKFVGLGEKVSDLEEFNAQDFVYGLFKGLVTVD